MERWLPVPGFEGYYETSSSGSVRNARTGRPLKPEVDKDGYLRVTLTRPGVRKHRRVHQLVLLAFVGPPPTNRPLALHGANGKLDCSTENLYYGTSARNQSDDRARDCTLSASRTDEDIRVIKQRHASGETQRSLARELGMSQGAISMAVRGITWKHLTERES